MRRKHKSNWAKDRQLTEEFKTHSQVIYHTDLDAGFNCIYFSEYWNILDELDVTASEEDL